MGKCLEKYIKSFTVDSSNVYLFHMERKKKTIILQKRILNDSKTKILNGICEMLKEQIAKKCKFLSFLLTCVFKTRIRATIQMNVYKPSNHFGLNKKATCRSW